MSAPRPGLDLVVDAARFDDRTLKHACMLVHALAGRLAPRPVADVLLALAVGLETTRMDRESALEALSRAADDEGGIGGLASELPPDYLDGWEAGA